MPLELCLCLSNLNLSQPGAITECLQTSTRLTQIHARKEWQFKSLRFVTDDGGDGSKSRWLRECKGTQGVNRWPFQAAISHGVHDRAHNRLSGLMVRANKDRRKSHYPWTKDGGQVRTARRKEERP